MEMMAMFSAVAAPVSAAFTAVSGPVGLVTGLVGAAAQIGAGKTEAANYQFQAQTLEQQAIQMRYQAGEIEADIAQEETAAAVRELERQQTLGRVLGAQQASFASRGIALGPGTVLDIASESVGEARRESMIDRSNVALAIARSRRNKANLLAEANMKVVGSQVMRGNAKAAKTAGYVAALTGAGDTLVNFGRIGTVPAPAPSVERT